jgi:choline dehydrogenase-like flavoprotein
MVCEGHRDPDEEARPYRWIRMPALADRLLGWERQFYRMSDVDFNGASQDEYGNDCPISYRGMALYYGEVERQVGITGNSETFSHLPDNIITANPELSK